MEDSNQLDQQVREKRRVAASSMVAAVFLTGAKLVVGLLTGSLGILAEAAHSALDLVAAFITFLAVRISDRPADKSHLYGHGKVENLSALIETGLLFLTCIWIIYEAVNRLFFTDTDVDPSIWAFLVVLFSIVIDISRSRALGRVARKYGSQALEADALHFSTDIWSSAVVLVGLGLVKLGEYRGAENGIYERADAGAALIVAFIVIFVSCRLGRRAIQVLLDRAPEGLADRISDTIGNISGIRSVSRARVRNVGNRMFVDIKVDVPRHLPFEKTHELTKAVQEKICAISPGADVVVQTVPTGTGTGILETIQSVAAREHASIHNISTHRTGRELWIDLDLEVDPNISFEYAHQAATELEYKLRNAFAQNETATSVAGIHVHIEPYGEGTGVGQKMEETDIAPYREKVQAIGRQFDAFRKLRSMTLHKLGDKVYLSLQLAIRSDIPISEIHVIAEEVESRLRRECPELGRVVIHTEPDNV